LIKFLFIRSEYNLKFFSLLNFSFNVLYFVFLLLLCLFRFFIYLFQQITTGFDSFAFFISFFIVIVMLYPFYLALRFLISLFNKDVAFKYFVNSSLKRFCHDNKFICVGYKPDVRFSFNDCFLIVKFRLDGSSISKKFDNLGEQLLNMLVLDLDSNFIEDGFSIYKFRRTELKRESVQDIINSDSIRFIKDSIVLSERYVWNYRKCPHGLVAGITGSGKTFLFAYFLIIFIKIKASFCIIDPKRADLAYLEKYFGKDVVFEKNQIVRILRESAELIDLRMDSITKREDYVWGADYSNYKEIRPYFIIFDEAAAYFGTIDKKLKDECKNYLNKIILEGRQAGVFIIFAMQRPDVSFIDGAIRDQLGLRVALGSMSNDGYKMVFGDEGKDLVLSDLESGFVKDLKILKPLEFKTPYMNIDFIATLEKLINYKKNVDDVEVS